MDCLRIENSVSITGDHGAVVPCCNLDIGVDDKWIQYSTIQNFENLNQPLKSFLWFDLKEQLSKDWPDPCSSCKKREELNLKSLRTYAYGDIGKVDKESLSLLELSLDFSCNMMCRTCRPGISSRWTHATKLNDNLKLIDKEHYSNMSNQNFSARIKTLLYNTNFEHLKKIHLVGGEPFISPNIQWFFDLLDDKCDLSRIEFIVHTNGSIFPNSKIRNVLSKFKDIQINISIDAIGDLAEVNRIGVPWKKIDKVIRKWIDFTQPIYFAPVISLMNINKLQDLIEYKNSLPGSIIMKVGHLTWPSFLCSNQIPLEVRKKWKINIQDDDVDYFNNYILDNEVSENKFTDFVRSMKLMDEYQNISFSEANSELWDIVCGT